MPPVTRHLTILFTDIKGFTDKTSQRSRSEIQELLDKHREIVLPVLEARGGKLVKTIGDAFLMVFESPTEAVLAGVDVQEALARHNAESQEDDRIEVRIAINAGEVNLAENDVFGEPVNIASRIEGVAQAGEVFFTEAVYLAMNKTEVPSSEVGLLQLKGIPEKVRVYKVKKEQPVGEAAPEPSRLRSLLGFLRPPEPALEASEKARPVASPGMGRPSMTIRAAAFAIDVILVFLFVAQLTGGRDEVVRVHREKRAKHETASKPDVQIGKDGLHVESEGASVTFGKDGISVKESKTPKGRRLEVDAEDDDDAETLYEKDGVKVSRESRKKNIAFPVFWLAYSTLFLGLWKATPGKRICKLTVVRMNGLSIDWKDAFIRSLFSLISFIPPFIGFLWAAWEKDRRGWHDLLAGTRVEFRPF